MLGKYRQDDVRRDGVGEGFCPVSTGETRLSGGKKWGAAALSLVAGRGGRSGERRSFRLAESGASRLSRSDGGARCEGLASVCSNSL